MGGITPLHPTGAPVDIKQLGKEQPEQIMSKLKNRSLQDLATIYADAKNSRGTGFKAKFDKNYTKIIKAIETINTERNTQISSNIEFFKGLHGYEDRVIAQEGFARYYQGRFPNSNPGDESRASREMVNGYLNSLSRRTNVDEKERPLMPEEERLIAEIGHLRASVESALETLPRQLNNASKIGLLESPLFAAYFQKKNIRMSHDSAGNLLANNHPLDQNSLKLHVQGFLSNLNGRLNPAYTGADKPSLQQVYEFVHLVDMVKSISKVEQSEDIVDAKGKSALNLVENDNQPAPTNILDNLAKIRDESLDLKKPLDLIQGSDQPLKDGQTVGANGKSHIGDIEVNFANVMRANSLSHKAIEDQVSISGHTFRQQGGPSINTMLIVSNDGNQKNLLSSMYSMRAKEIFEQTLQELVQHHTEGKITPALVQYALAKTHHQILDVEWREHLRAHPQDVCGTTSNMVFLMPFENTLCGVVFNAGDSRAVLLKKDGDVMRLGGPEEGQQSGAFIVEPGDHLFISSDGIWHNASPTQVNTFIRERMDDFKDSIHDRGDRMQAVLLDLVKATLPGREDDRNPVLISIPE